MMISIIKMFVIGLVTVVVVGSFAYGWGMAWQHVVPFMTIKDAGIFGIALIVVGFSCVVCGAFVQTFISEFYASRSDD